METSIPYVESLSEFMEALERIIAPWRGRWTNGATAWYRGHADASWDLEPSALREPYFSGGLTLANSFHATFKARALPYLTSPPRDALHWIMLARHHGIPTRLLDWTESAATALYFAVRPQGRNEADGAVWILDCLWLCKATVGTVGVVTSDFAGANVLAEPQYHGDAVPAPMPVFPNKIAPRMVAQHSCFTLHSWERDALRIKADTETLPRPLQEIRVPAKAKESVRKSLATFGVDESVVFPDLDGLVRSLRLRLANDASGF